MQNCSITTKELLCSSFYSHPSHCSSLSCFYALETTSLFSIISSVWKCYINGITQYVILWDRLFYWIKYLRSPSRFLHFPIFHSFLWWVVFHCFDVPEFIQPFTLWRKLDCFQSFAITNEAAVNIVYRFYMTIVFWYVSFNVSSKCSLSTSFLFCVRYPKIIFYFLTVLESALAPRDPGSFNGK